MKILIAGDFCPRDRIYKQIEEDSWKEIIDPAILSTIKDADYSIVNFECPVAERNAKPISKCGPSLKCTAKGVGFVKEIGFQCVTLANNHFRDFGDEGVSRTIEVLKNHGLDYVGGGMNITEATRTLYKEISGDTLAIINVCENEFSIASNIKGGSAPLDTIDVFHRIAEARAVSDFVIVIVHGGHEHFQYPSPRMKKLYRFFVESGADAVINHHQHCYSGTEEYKGKPIIYGLGNFCFDHPQKRKGIWNEGYMVDLIMNKGEIHFELIPYTQCDETPTVDLMKESMKQNFSQKVCMISDIISDDQQLQQKYEEMLAKQGRSFLAAYTPYTNEYVQIAAARHYIPYLIPKKKLAKMLNLIRCESHRDLLIESMQKRLEQQ